MSDLIKSTDLAPGLSAVDEGTIKQLAAMRGDVAGGRFRFDSHFHYTPHALPNLYTRNDDRSGLFFERQLKSMIPQMFEVEHGMISARSVFPVSRDGGPGTETITYNLEEDIGEAKIVGDYATDIPSVNVKGEEFDTKVRSLAVSASWSVQEIRAAAMARKNLRGSLARAARKAMIRTENRLAWFGDANYGVRGLFTAGTGIPSSAAATAWPTVGAASAADILADLNACANGISTATLGNWTARKVLLPLSAFNYIATTNAGLGTDKTILASFVENSPYIGGMGDVVGVQELEDYDGAGNRAMVCLNDDPDVLRMETPLDLEQFAPQEMGMATKVIWHMRVAGLIIPRPLAVNILTGI